VLQPLRLSEQQAQPAQLPCEQAQWLHLPSGLRARVAEAAEGAHIIREVFEQRCYEQHGVVLQPRPADAAASAAGRPPLVIDVGAHVGLFALRALTLLPHARLIAVEPAARTCELLRANLEANGLAARAYVVGAAAGARAGGEAVLRFYPRSPSNSTCRPAEREAAQRGALAPWRLDAALDERCAATSVSHLLAGERARRAAATGASEGADAEVVVVQLLKVDVEGDELEVLRGVDAADWPCIEQVALEAHALDGRLEAVLLLLRGAGGFAWVRATRDAELATLGLDNWLVHACRGTAAPAAERSPASI
jgi:FkbM family methyltransferase